MKLFKASVLGAFLLLGFSNQAHAVNCYGPVGNGSYFCAFSSGVQLCSPIDEGAWGCSPWASNDSNSGSSDVNENLLRSFEEGQQQAAAREVLKFTDSAGKTYTGDEAKKKFNDFMGIGFREMDITLPSNLKK